MKTSMLSLLAGCLLLPPLQAETSPSSPRLAGIVNLPKLKSVVLEVSAPHSQTHWLILDEGQSEETIRVIRIHPETGSVEVWPGRTNAPVTLSLPRRVDRIETVTGSLELVKVNLDSVLELYAKFKGRTLLRWPTLPATTFTLTASTTNQLQAAQMLEQALNGQGMATIPDGEKFLMVVPVSETAGIKPRTTEIKTAKGVQDQTELLPAGSINFVNVDLTQVAQIYAALIGRKVDLTQRPPVPTMGIHFKSQTPLTKAECIHALDTLFAWQGVKVVPEDDKLAKLVAIPSDEK